MKSTTIIWLTRATIAIFFIVIAVVIVGLAFLVLSLRREVTELRELILGDTMAPRLEHAMYEFLSTPRHRRILISELLLQMKIHDNEQNKNTNDGNLDQPPEISAGTFL
jgi:hypothetical protein